MKRLTLSVSVLLVVLGVWAVGTQANAAILGAVPGQLNLLDDSDADIGVRETSPGVFAIVAGALQDNDILVAGITFAFTRPIPGTATSLAGQGYNGFTMLKVDGAPVDQGGGLSSFAFNAASVAEWNGVVDDLFGGLASLKKSSEGTLAMIFQDATADFSPVSPPATLAASAAAISTGANLVWELGFTGALDAGGNVDAGVDEGWVATGPTSPSVAATTTYGTGIPGTSFTGALNPLVDNSGYVDYLPLTTLFGQSDFAVVGTLSGYGDGFGNPAGPWQIASDADLSFAPLVVPEPASLAIWSLLSVGGLALARRRRRA